MNVREKVLSSLMGKSPEDNSPTSEIINNAMPSSENFIRPDLSYRENQINDQRILHDQYRNNMIQPSRNVPYYQTNFYQNGQQYVNPNGYPSQQTVPQQIPYAPQYYPNRPAGQYVNPMDPYNQGLPPVYSQQPPTIANYQQPYHYVQQYQQGYTPAQNGYGTYQPVDQAQQASAYGTVDLNVYNLQSDAPFVEPHEENFAANPLMTPAVIGQPQPQGGNMMMANSAGFVGGYDQQPLYQQQSHYVYAPDGRMVQQNQLSGKLDKATVNQLMPKEIGHEIRSEKFRTFLMICFGLVGSLVCALFIGLYFYAHKMHQVIIWQMDVKYIPHPFATIILLIVCFAILCLGVVNLTRVKMETRRYLQNMQYGSNIPPMFLVDNYKKMVVRRIVLNWIAFPTYVFGAIILGILYGFQQHAGKPFMFAFWSLGKVKDLTTEITINIIVLIAMLALHVANLVITQTRINNLRSYYGYEIVAPEEIAAIKKRTNRICLIIFLVIIILITLVITISIFMAKRRKGELHSFWPWNWGSKS